MKDFAFLTWEANTQQQWFPKFSALWNYLGSFRKYWCLCPSPRDYDLTGLRYALSFESFKTRIGDSNMQFGNDWFGIWANSTHPTSPKPPLLLIPRHMAHCSRPKPSKLSWSLCFPLPHAPTPLACDQLSWEVQGQSITKFACLTSRKQFLLKLILFSNPPRENTPWFKRGLESDLNLSPCSFIYKIYKLKQIV